MLVVGLLIIAFSLGCYMCLKAWGRDVERAKRPVVRRDNPVANGHPPGREHLDNGHPPVASPVPHDVLQGKKTHVFVNPNDKRRDRKSSIPQFIVTSAKKRFSVFKKKEPRPVSWLDYERRPPPVGHIDKGAGFYSSEYTVMDTSVKPLNVRVLANSATDSNARNPLPPAQSPIITVSDGFLGPGQGEPHLHRDINYGRQENYVARNPEWAAAIPSPQSSSGGQVSAGGEDGPSLILRDKRGRDDDMFVSSIVV